MNALDSSLEALAFNYLSHGLLRVVDKIWRWVAVLTAAVGFWRIRASSELPHGKCPHGLEAAISEPVALLNNHASNSHAEPEKTILSFKNVPFCAWDGEAGTKGKLTLYYCEEKDGEICGDGYDDGEVMGDSDDDDDGDDNGGEYGEGWWSKWEMVMKIKEGDDEWYSYQDLMMIDGNVVRLWDGGCRRRRSQATPPYIRGGCS